MIVLVFKFSLNSNEEICNLFSNVLCQMFINVSVFMSCIQSINAFLLLLLANIWRTFYYKNVKNQDYCHKQCVTLQFLINWNLESNSRIVASISAW